MTLAEFLQVAASVAAAWFAALSGSKWHAASKIEMPAKQDVPPNLPGMHRVHLMGEDYAITLARINEGLTRLDASADALNRSAALNEKAARYAMYAALALAISIAVPMIAMAIDKWG